MSERDTFGPRLRSERERRGISIETIVTVTKVGADLWLGLERNDFSKWPSGIFARAFVRDYAKAVENYEAIQKLPKSTWPAGLEIRLALAKKRVK